MWCWLRHELVMLNWLRSSWTGATQLSSALELSSKHSDNAGKWIDIFGPAFCICYFLWLAGDGLTAFFTGDDVQNLVHLHGYFRIPLLEILQQALTVVTGEYRPIGGLFYRLLYSVFGFDPFPFRVAAFTLMGGNLLLAYNLVRTLAGSREAALIATFLLCYNSSLFELYHSTGTIYDILCFGFFVGAFQVYLNARRGPGRFGLNRVASILILYSCALGSKEMAVALPVVLVLYELVYHQNQFLHRNIIANLFKPHFLTIAGLAILTAAYSAVKLVSENPMSIPAYSAELSFGKFTAALGHYLPRWLHCPILDETSTLALVAAAGAIACLTRVKECMFGIGLLIIALLPVAFIPLRGGFVFYLPALGCVLFLGSVAARVLRQLFDWSERAVESERRGIRRFLALRGVPFLILVAALTPIHVAGSNQAPAHFYDEYSRQIISDLQRMHPDFPDGAVLYFDDDPYPKDYWTLLFLTQLAYDNPTIHVERRKILGLLRHQARHVFRFTFLEGRLEPVLESLPSIASSENVIRILFQPEIVRPGEKISVQVEGFTDKAIDLYWKHYVAGGLSYDTGMSTNWCSVDDSGLCSVLVPINFPQSRIEILYVRETAGPGKWHAAQGVLEVAP